MNWLQFITVAALAAVLSAGATAFYYRQRTKRRLKRLSLLVKGLAMGDLEQNLDSLDLTDEGDLVELTSSITQLAMELKAVIQRISAERNTMSALLQNMSDGIISTDETGRVTNINEAARRLLGLPSGASVEGRSFMQVVRDHEVNSLLKQTLEDGEERQQMLEVGPLRPQLQVKVTLIKEEGQRSSKLPVRQHRSALVMLQDLTELMRLERIRRDFVANISHELRTPLASVKLMVETLQNVIEDNPSDAQQFLTRIDTEIDGLTQLVRELLELSRIESGQIKLNFKATDLREMVEQAAERLRAQAERSGLSIEVVRGSEESFPSAMVDPDRVMQVLINLIHNAIKFTPVGGTISLSVKRARGTEASGAPKLLVQVKDTGVGIPPDDLSRIFERFYKVDKARAGYETGTGLGLAIAKHIIQAHGGEVWAESEVGVGSTFCFTVPALQIA
ncbi:MAG TPA: ATP-binding protein [Chloroflexia bacterium]|nr:ATP-binding protein [Chloroflexia bacterium]